MLCPFQLVYFENHEQEVASGVFLLLWRSRQLGVLYFSGNRQTDRAAADR